MIDYRINMAEQGGSFNVIDTTSSLSYLVTSLTPGTTYEFTVEARNQYDYSDESATLTLLNAYIPQVPTGIVTTIESEQVKVAWTLPSDNGSPITNYKVYL